MILQGKPNLIVNKRTRKGGKMKIVGWFRFDKKGFVEIDESKLSLADIQKLKKKFKVIEKKPTVIDNVVDYSKMKYQELQSLYTEKTGKTAVGKKKADILKELEV